MKLASTFWSTMKNRKQWLIDQIEKANDFYWNKNDQIVSDEVYHGWIEELRTLDPQHPLVNYAGNDNIAGTKVKHVEHMYSLGKVYRWPDLIKWCEKVARSEDELFCFSCKYDGLAVEFANNRLITRGTGDVGTDITHLAPWIKVRLSWSFQTVESMFMTLIKNNDGKHGHFGRMTGELLIPTDHFKKLKNTYPCLAEYKTPRNMASGFANLKPDSEVLKSLIYGGLPIPICTWVHHRAHELTYTLKDLRSREAEIVNKLRNYKKCPCDGIVCRLEDEEYAKGLGFTQHHPLGSIALKFENDEYTSVVRSIDWQVGNEAVTPVANFDPIDIDGVEVARATCHNARFVAQTGLTVGATVTIVRKGEVIPQVVKVEPLPSTIKEAIPTNNFPEVCPVCGEKLTYIEPDLLCTNEHCIGRIVNKIVHGLHLLGVKGLGPSLVERICHELMIETIIDFCSEAWDEMVLKAKGFSACEIKTLTNELERVMNTGVEDHILFASLCIPEAAKSFAEKVIKYTGDIMTLADISNEVLEKLKTIPGLNSTALNNVVDWMDENKAEFEAYYNLFTHIRPVDRKDRVNFCFTGALPQPRKELEAWVLKHGGYPTDNIRQANFLVSADPLSTSSKMKYAREHNIPVITFDDMVAELTQPQ